MHRLFSIFLLLALLSDKQSVYASKARKDFVDRRGLLQLSPEEQRALDNLSIVFAEVSGGSSFTSDSPPSPSPLPPPPPPPPPPISPSSSLSPAPSTATPGARFTPAPAVFNRLNLPTYSKISQTSGPVSPETLNDAAPSDGGSCKSLKEILSSIPQVSQWLDLLISVGYESILLTDTDAQVTLLVPVNSAFSAGIDAQPLRDEETLQQLISNAPDVRTPLAGYSVVTGLWPSSTLTSGTSLPTANTIDKVNSLNIDVLGPTQLQGVGDSAIILQADIAACGPSVVHIIDQILLPFRFDQGPTDAITGTQVPRSTDWSGDSEPSPPPPPATAAAG
ncbi:hypothetical protein Ndes2526A_g05460 [Nannochloris sp. 'desiccata']